MDTEYIALRTLVFISIGFLIAGWRWGGTQKGTQGDGNDNGNRTEHRSRRAHQFTMIGWFLFGLYWLLQVPHYLDHNEPHNAAYCVLGFPLFMFLLYHEHLSMKWGDDPAPLPFMAGTVGMSAAMYFLIDTFDQVAAFFVLLTAAETAAFLNMFGYEASVGSVSYDDFVRVPIFHGEQRGISIILACTAIQSIVIFISAIWTTRVEKDPVSKTISIYPPPRIAAFWQFRVQPFLATYTTIRFSSPPPPSSYAPPPSNSSLTSFSSLANFGVTRDRKSKLKLTLTRKWKAFLITVPTILILNIVRTAGVIYLVYEGHYEFDVAHDYLSRWGSMLVLIVLAYLMFDILPELHDNIVGIPMLIKRKKPEEGDNDDETA